MAAGPTGRSGARLEREAGAADSASVRVGSDGSHRFGIDAPLAVGELGRRMVEW